MLTKDPIDLNEKLKIHLPGSRLIPVWK